VTGRLFSRTVLRLAVLVSLLLPAARLARAEDILSLMLKPGKNEKKIITNASAAVYTEETAESDLGKKDFDMGRYEGDLVFPIVTGGDHELFTQLSTTIYDMDTEVRFDRSGEEVPGRLADLGAHAAYRQFLGNGWVVGAAARVGSASDQLFESNDETYVGGTLFARIPHGEHNAWLVMIDGDSQRDAAVVPGVGYQLALSKTDYAIIGMPISLLHYKLTDKWTFDGRYVALRNAHVSVNYALRHDIDVTAAFDWDYDSFKREGQKDDDVSIQYTEKRASLGVEYRPAEGVSLALTGGYAFDRELFEVDEYEDRHKNDIEIDGAGFAQVSLNILF
jgi:hypothetical protein